MIFSRHTSRKPVETTTKLHSLRKLMRNDPDALSSRLACNKYAQIRFSPGAASTPWASPRGSPGLLGVALDWREPERAPW